MCMERVKQQPIRLSLCRSLCRQCHWKCLVLSVLVSTCLVALAWCKLSLGDITSGRSRHETGFINACEDSYVYIPVAFVLMMYIVYLVECWHCRLRAELDDRVDAATVYELIRRLVDATPIVWWRAICYHYVRRTRQVARYRNGDAFSSTQVYYERVNSHAASAVYDFRSAGVRDVSRRLVDLEKRPCTRVRFTKRFSFASVEAENDYERQRSAFFGEHECRDDYIETREGVDFDGTEEFRERVVVFADPSRVPWYLSRWAFWLASVVLMSWPLRVFVQYKIAYVHYYIHKVFGVVSGHRDVGMATSSSDVALPSNNALIPSYSEAMRMDNCGRASDTTELFANHTVASTANVDLGVASSSTAVVPLLQGFQRPCNESTNVFPASAVGTGRTVYGTVIYDCTGRAFFRSDASCPERQQDSVPVQMWSTRNGGDDLTTLRSRRGDAQPKRKRRRSYNEAVGAPSSSESSLTATRAESRESGRRRRQRRSGTSAASSDDAGRGMSTSMSTPESFDKLQKAADWIEQLRPVQSFVEGGVTRAPEADNDDVESADCRRSSSTLQSTAQDLATPAVPTATPNPHSDPIPTHSAYDVVGRRVVRCRQSLIDNVVDVGDDDLPPSYEDALRMRIVPFDVSAAVHLDDVSSVSTTSTYLSSSEFGAGDTPRRWKAFVRRPYAVVELSTFHVETSL